MTQVKLPLEFFLAYIFQHYQNKDPGTCFFRKFCDILTTTFPQLFRMDIYWISLGFLTIAFLMISGVTEVN